MLLRPADREKGGGGVLSWGHFSFSTVVRRAGLGLVIKKLPFSSGGEKGGAGVLLGIILGPWSYYSIPKLVF